MKLKDEAKLEAIFTATLDLTSSVGIAGLKMSNIAKKANIASGTLYIYFRSKEELLNALYIRIKKEGTLSIIESLKSLPVKIQLYKIWENMLKYLVNNHARTIFLEQFVISPFISSESKELNQQFTKYLVALLEQGKEEGIIKALENELLIALMKGFLRDFSFHLVSQQAKAEEKTINQSFSLCWDAIKA